MSSLCEYSEAYILLKETTTAVGQEADDVAIASNRNNTQVVFKCALLTRCISGINNTQINIVTELDAKSSWSLWQYHKDVSCNPMTNSESPKFKSSPTSNTDNTGIANIEIAVSLKCLSNS